MHLKAVICYSDRDATWLERLRVHLKPLVDNGTITLWDSTQVAPGNDRQKTIDTVLRAADLAILLISADFLASETIANEQLPALSRPRAVKFRVLPVIVSPCAYTEQLDLLTQNVAVSSTGPLSAMSSSEAETALARLAQSIDTHARQQLLSDIPDTSSDGSVASQVASDGLTSILDPHSSHRSGFRRAADHASQLQDMPDGFPEYLTSRVGPTEVLGQLISQYGIRTLTTCIDSAVPSLGSEIKRCETPPESDWPRDTTDEQVLADCIDAALIAQNPEESLQRIVDASPGNTAARIAAALIPHFRGEYLKTLASLDRILRGPTLHPYLVGILRWRRAKALGTVGRIREARSELECLADNDALGTRFRANVLREAAHWGIYHAWTTGETIAWDGVDRTLARAEPALAKLPSEDSRSEWLRASHAEFRAIVDFAASPSHPNLSRVTESLERFTAIDPTFGAFRQAPLAVLFMRMGENRAARELVRHSRNQIRSSAERGLSLIVESQACIRMNELSDALDLATSACAAFRESATLGTEMLFASWRTRRSAYLYDQLKHEVVGVRLGLWRSLWYRLSRESVHGAFFLGDTLGEIRDR